LKLGSVLTLIVLYLFSAQAGAVQSGTVSKNGEFKIAVYVIVETTPDSGGLLLNSVMTDSVEIISELELSPLLHNLYMRYSHITFIYMTCF